MALDAGSVFAVLGGKFNPAGFAQFDAAMKKSTASATAAEKSHARSAGAMTLMGTAAKTGAAVGIAAVGYALVKSVQSAATFEKKMSELQAVTKASSSTMKTMSKAALDLGAKTGIGATEAAGALTELAKGGLDAETSIAALTGTIALAQAGDMELADAANTVVKSLSLFNLAGADAGHVADGLASAANATSMDVKDFAQALAQGGSAAAAAGFSFDDTINVMASMADKFQSGSDLGTSLKTTLVQMANPSAKAAAEMKRLNISLFDSNNKIKPVASIVKMLTNRFEGMSDKQKLSTAATIAGTDGMRTLLALLGGSGKDIIVPGSAADIAARKMDNFEGAMERATAQAESLKIELGQSLLPALGDAAGGLADFIGAMRAGEGTAGAFANALEFVGKTFNFMLAGIAGGASLVAEFLAQMAFMAAVLKVPGADEAYTKLRRIATGLKEIGVNLTTTKIDVDDAPAIKAIKKIQDSKIAPKVAKILGEKKDADSKIKALIALGIPKKTARVLAETGSAEAALARVRRDLANISSKTVTLTIKQVGQAVGNAFTPKPKASGARAGTAQTAIVGEGGGPEWIVDRATGKARKVSGAQLASLNENEYVIPTESKYRPQALGLLSMLAADLGVAGFARGRQAARRPAPPRPPAASAAANKETPKQKAEKKRKEDAAKRRRELNALLGDGKNAYALHPSDWFDTEIDKLTTRAGKKHKVKGKSVPTSDAERAKKELVKIKAAKKRALEYTKKIDAATREADIQTSEMQRLANLEEPTADDQKAFAGHYGIRKAKLNEAVRLLTLAMGVPGAGGEWLQTIRAQAAALGADVTAMKTNPDDIVKAAEEAKKAAAGTPDAETTYTAAEQTALDNAANAVALAQLNTPNDITDDQTAVGGQIAVLQAAFNAASSNAGDGRGGITAVTQIANDLRGAKEQLAGLVAPTPTITPDQQAQLDQTARNQTMAAQSAAIDRLVGATLGGSPTLVFQSYVPPSPTEARRLADYTVGGIGYQGATQSSKDSVGI